MEFTSASANKYLRRLQDEKDYILNTELECCTYVLGEGEAADPPAYRYRETRDKIAEIDRVTRILPHGLHQFNMATALPQCGLTIDEALIALAQLSLERDRVVDLRASAKGAPGRASRWSRGRNGGISLRQLRRAGSRARL